MKAAPRSCKLFRLLTVILLCLLPCLEGRAQIKFVQLTDIHLIDKDDGVITGTNKRALEDCVKKINELAANDKYQFVVVTGDIGVEKIVKSITLKPHDTNSADDKSIQTRIEERAGDLAAIISESKIETWLFVPGNNDLVDEWPETIGYYHKLVRALADAAKPNVRIVDLSPRANVPGSGVYETGDYTFIGFNNASFKNNDDPDRITLKHGSQLDEISLVSARLRASQRRYAYIFYHIPEVPDPFLEFEKEKEEAKKKLEQRKAALTNDLFSKEDLTSSWFVAADVGAAWTNLISDQKVKGLFAGHLHDPHRKYYLDYNSWLGPRLSDFACATLNKLYITPPIAIKRQEDAQKNGQETARGFRVVNLDQSGMVVTAQGARGTQIFWFTQANAPDARAVFEPNAKTDERQDVHGCRQGVRPVENHSCCPPKGPGLPWYKDISKLKDLITAVGLLLGGIFAYYKFIKGRVFKPRLELKVSGKVITQKQKRLLVASAQIKNNGLSVVYLDDQLTGINLYRSSQLKGTTKEQQPAWLDPVNGFPLFTDHKWVEPDETITDEILIELRDDEDVAYRIKLVVRSRQPSFRERYESRKKHKASGGEWNSTSIVEQKAEQEHN